MRATSSFVTRSKLAGWLLVPGNVVADWGGCRMRRNTCIRPSITVLFTGLFLYYWSLVCPANLLQQQHRQ